MEEIEVETSQPGKNVVQVTIETLGPLRKYLPENESSTTVTLPEGTTVGDALRAIGIPLGAAWNAGIEGQLVYADRVLEEGDRLLAFAPIGGGD